jgi:hypothetical protein
MEECKDLLSSAENQAETTVLNGLIRNWRSIANQTERYTDLVAHQTSERVRWPKLAEHFSASHLTISSIYRAARREALFR